MTNYTHEQVASLINAQRKNIFGTDENIVAPDLSDIADVNKSFTDETRIKLINNMLVNGLRIMIEDKKIKLPFPEFFKSQDDWNAFIAQYDIVIPELIDSTHINKVSGVDFSAMEHTFIAPEVKAQYWDEPERSFMVTYCIDNVRVDLEKLFNNPEEITAWISAQHSAAEKAVITGMSIFFRDTIASLAGKLMKAGKVRKFLNEYNELHEDETGFTPLYKSNCWSDMNFVGYVLEQINLIKESFMTTGTENNIAGYEQLTLEGEFYLMLITDFEQKIKAYYNPMVRNDGRTIETLPEHKTTYFWMVNKPDFDTRSKMAVVIDSETVEMDNVLGLAFDFRAVAIHNERVISTQAPTASGNFTKYFNTVLLKGIINTTQNACLLLLGDDPE